MPDDNKDDKTTPPADDAGEKKPAEAGATPPVKTEEELAAEKEAQEKADKEAAEELEKDKADTVATKEQNKQLQSQVAKIRQGALDKQAELASKLKETEDPGEKIEIERAILDLDKGLFELDKEASAGMDLAGKVSSTLKELGYAEDSEVAKKLFAIVESKGDTASELIDSQLETLRLIGTKIEEKKLDEKKPADIDEDKGKGEKPAGDTTPSVNAEDFSNADPKKREEASKNLEEFLGVLAKKGI